MHAGAASIPIAILFVLAAVVSAVELLRHGRAPRSEGLFDGAEANTVHIAMNLGMAWMATSLFDARAEAWLTALYGALLAALLLRIGWASQRLERDRLAQSVGPSVYHILGLAGMIYAIRLMAMPAMDGGMAGMNGMAGMAMPAMAAPPLGARLLGSLFAADAAATTLLAILMPRRIFGPAIAGMPDTVHGGRLRLEAGLAVLPHVVMDVGMAGMLL